MDQGDSPETDQGGPVQQNGAPDLIRGIGRLVFRADGENDLSQKLGEWKSRDKRQQMDLMRPNQSILLKD